MRAISNMVVLTPEGQPDLNGTCQQEITRYRRVTQIWRAPRIRGRSALRCSRPAAWVSYPGGPGRELAAGFEQCEEKEVSPHIQHTPGN